MEPKRKELNQSKQKGKENSNEKRNIYVKMINDVMLTINVLLYLPEIVTILFDYFFFIFIHSISFLHKLIFILHFQASATTAHIKRPIQVAWLCFILQYECDLAFFCVCDE